jgi:peptidoglycan hydrolase-like protein with peptidoglycan-binding domain
MYKKQKLRVFLASLLLILTISSFIYFRHTSNASPGHAANLAWPAYSQGYMGEDVFTIQLLLLNHNYTISLNGAFDTKTLKAVKAFQMDSHFIANGVVDQMIWPVLLGSLYRGNLGMAVVALQRQLAAHGAKVVPTGEFNLQTLAALKSYQHNHGLTTSGVADLQTWSSLLRTPASAKLPPPPHFARGRTLWGVDTAPPVTLASLRRIIQKFGRPYFIGKYLNGTAFTSLSAAEAALIHRQGMRIMLLEADSNRDTGYSRGASLALQAVARAHALGISKGVAIFADLEPGSRVDAGWIEAWYNVLSKAGYTPGYYGNPYADHNFNSPFCLAIGHYPAIARKAVLDIYQPMLIRSPATRAPLFKPSIPYCGTTPAGNVLVWQYGLSGGDHTANVDTDELKVSVPLW